MNKNTFGLRILIFLISIVCLINSLNISKTKDELNEKITKLKQENIELKWQLEQVDQIICVNGGVDNE